MTAFPKPDDLRAQMKLPSDEPRWVLNVWHFGKPYSWYRDPRTGQFSLRAGHLVALND